MYLRKLSPNTIHQDDEDLQRKGLGLLEMTRRDASFDTALIRTVFPPSLPPSSLPFGSAHKSLSPTHILRPKKKAAADATAFGNVVVGLD
ncbi:hypothetical protein SAMN04488036_10963 [Shimia haliotis]|uniref:Uncharacterized protein n=1 Tax=Shimia haliotis TaxID=1280847 RepID=A0A1I4GM58_9RHOB|nr:hypothetical protein SAMN04488036_10963 [Shimia haliotis]